MSTSPGFRRGRLNVVLPNAAALAAATSPRLAFDRMRENDMRQATARKRAMCSSWADAWERATAIEPCGFQLIYRSGKVNRTA